MNIGFFLKPKAHIILTTMFFIGMIASAAALYLIPCKHAENELDQVYCFVGGTFLAGMIALYTTARSRKTMVVYLDRKKENTAETEHKDKTLATQLNLNLIKEMMKNTDDIFQKTINELCRQLNAGQGAVYMIKDQAVELTYGYALSHDGDTRLSYSLGEGLVGRVAAEGRSIYVDKLPEGYITVFSGLGAASPNYLVIVPLKSANEVLGVMEIATFEPIHEDTRKDLESIGELLAEVIE